MGLAICRSHVVAGLGPLGVVLCGLAVEPLGLGIGRTLAVDRLEIDPGRHPDDGPHAVLAHPADQPGRVGELMGVEAPGVVLRLPRRVDDDRVEGEVVVAVAAPVVLDVLLVLVDVAALPVAVGPLGHQRRQAGLAEERAQARGGRRACEEVDAQRAGARSDGDGDLVPSEIRLDAGPRGLDPGGPARRGEQPGHGGVVALGDATLLQEVGRAVGTRVAAVRAELDAAAALVEVEAMPGAEARDTLAVDQRPAHAEAQPVRLSGIDRDQQPVRGGGGDLDVVLAEPHRVLALLMDQDPLRQRDQLVARDTPARPRAQPRQQPGGHLVSAPQGPFGHSPLECDADAPSVPTRAFTTSLRGGHDLVTGFSLQTATLRDVKTIERKRVR